MFKIKIIVLAFLIFTSPAQAAIYKCKQADGSIQYLGIPCPQGSKKADIKTLSKRKQGSAKIPALIALDQIKTASVGLSQIRRNGFSSYRFGDLKKQLREGKANSFTKELTGENKSDVWDHIIEISVEPQSKNIALYYIIEGRNYDEYKNPEKERRLNENDKSTHFDITPKKVNVHAVNLGLKDQSFLANHKLRPELQWKWQEQGFDCKMSSQLNPGITPNHLSLHCQYSE